MGSNEYTNFYCPPQCAGVESFRATVSQRAFPAHAHEGFVIGIILRGTQAFTHRGVVHLVPAGSLVFLNPQELHAVCAADKQGMSYQTLHIPARVMQAVGGSAFSFRKPVEYAPQFASRLAENFDSLDDATTPREVWFGRLSETLVELVARKGSTAQQADIPPDQRIRHLIEHIGHHITTPLMLVTLAREVEMSPQHLIRCFKQVMGVTPHTYIQARRTALAKQLLRTSAPADAAASAGFADQSHLTRWMKACYGTTPATYRKLVGTEAVKAISSK